MFSFFNRRSKRKEHTNEKNNSRVNNGTIVEINYDNSNGSNTPSGVNKNKHESVRNCDDGPQSAPLTFRDVKEHEKHAETDGGNLIQTTDIDANRFGLVPCYAGSMITNDGGRGALSKSESDIESTIKDILDPMGWKNRAKNKGKATRRRNENVVENTTIAHACPPTNEHKQVQQNTTDFIQQERINGNGIVGDLGKIVEETIDNENGIVDENAPQCSVNDDIIVDLNTNQDLVKTENLNPICLPAKDCETDSVIKIENENLDRVHEGDDENSLEATCLPEKERIHDEIELENVLKESINQLVAINLLSQNELIVNENNCSGTKELIQDSGGEQNVTVNDLKCNETPDINNIDKIAIHQQVNVESNEQSSDINKHVYDNWVKHLERIPERPPRGIKQNQSIPVNTSDVPTTQEQPIVINHIDGGLNENLPDDAQKFNQTNIYNDANLNLDVCDESSLSSPALNGSSNTVDSSKNGLENNVIVNGVNEIKEDLTECAVAEMGNVESSGGSKKEGNVERSGSKKELSKASSIEDSNKESVECSSKKESGDLERSESKNELVKSNIKENSNKENASEKTDCALIPQETSISDNSHSLVSPIQNKSPDTKAEEKVEFNEPVVQTKNEKHLNEVNKNVVQKNQTEIARPKNSPKSILKNSKLIPSALLDIKSSKIPEAKLEESNKSELKNKASNEDADELAKRNLVQQESKFTARVNELTQHLAARDAEILTLRQQMEQLEHDVLAKSSGMERLQAELQAANKESEYVRQKLRNLENDLTLFKQKNAELQEELVKKSDEIITLNNSNSAQFVELEVKVSDLTERALSLESQLGKVKNEKDVLEEQRKKIESEREEEKKIVQEALEEAIAEKKKIQDRWEKDFEKLRTVNTGREQQMLDDFEWKLREVEQGCKRKLEEKEKKAQELIKEAHQAIEEKVKRAEEQLNEVIYLKSYEAEVTQLRGLTHDQQKSLRIMTEKTEQLELSEANLKTEMAKLKLQIETEKKNLIKLKGAHLNDLTEKERVMVLKLEEYKGEVAVQWEMRMREECSRLKSELDQMHNEEKCSAVECIKQQKQQEFNLAKQMWEKKMNDTIKELETLKNVLSDKEESFRKEIERVQTNADRNNLELRRSLDKMDMSYSNQIEKLTDKYEKEIERITEESEKRIKDLEANWQIQMASTRTTLELVKEQMERDAEAKLQALDQHHRTQLEHQWEQLVQDKEEALQQISQKYRINCDKLKDEINNVHKSYAAKEMDLIKTIDDLKKELYEKDKMINDMQSNVDTLQGGLQVLNKELQNQSHELNKIQTTSDKKVRDVKERMLAEYKRQLSEQKYKVVTENQQQYEKMAAYIDNLQKKCQCLTELFQEMKIRYEKRDSRPEDLNLIADLRQIISEQEKDLATLTEEKRYYQLQLVSSKADSNHRLAGRSQDDLSPEYSYYDRNTSPLDNCFSHNYHELEVIEEVPCDDEEVAKENDKINEEVENSQDLTSQPD